MALMALMALVSLMTLMALVAPVALMALVALLALMAPVTLMALMAPMVGVSVDSGSHKLSTHIFSKTGEMTKPLEPPNLLTFHPSFYPSNRPTFQPFGEEEVYNGRNSERI